MTLKVEKIRAVIAPAQGTGTWGEVTLAYGMTEISPVSFHSSTADPVEKWVSTVGGPAAYRGQDRDREVPHHAVRHAFGGLISTNDELIAEAAQFEPGITVGVGVTVVLERR